MTLSSTDLATIAPGLVLLAAGLLVVGLDLVRGGIGTLARAGVSLVGALLSLGLLGERLVDGAPAVVGFHGTMVLDSLATVVSFAIVAATAVLVGIAPVDAVRRRIDVGEYYALLLFSAAGMTWLLAAADFVNLFISLEIMSIAVYILTGITRRNPRSTEAAMKYLVTGAFATGFLLLGATFLYGLTGSLRFDAIADASRSVTSPLLGVGFALVLVGLGFKLGAVPFHMWVPDVYEGAPTTSTAFMSVAVKAAGFGALVRLLTVAGANHPEAWAPLLVGVSAATMVVGNLLALQQRSVKRMLAFSSVAHTGYALMALATTVGADGSYDPSGASSAIFYVVTYTFMTLGAFLFLVYMGHEAGSGATLEWQDAETTEDLDGLARRHPWAAIGMIVLLASLGGMPPTAGFLGKLWVFQVAVSQGHVALAVLGVLTSLLSWAYYLRVIVAITMREPVATDEKPDPAIGWAVGAAVLVTVGLGLMPGAILGAAEASVPAVPPTTNLTGR